MKTPEDRLRASCAMCGGNLSNPTIYEGDTYRYVEVRGCCYDVEFYAPPGFKLDQYPYGEPLSEWPEDFQSEVILQLNTRARTDDALAIVADAPRIYRGEEVRKRTGHYWCVSEQCVVVVYQDGSVLYYDDGEAQLGVEHMEYVGPLNPDERTPTNSPSEGKG